jgi:hypothetical protein
MMLSLRSKAVTPPHAARRPLVAGLVLLAALLGLSLVLWSPFRSLSAATRPAQPTIDASLILHPRSTRIAAHLAGGITLRGTLSPTLPGANTVHVMVYTHSGTPVTAGRLTLNATMPGMVMAPVRAILHAHAGGFTGVLHLPMFGEYVARVAFTDTPHPWHGTLALTLPLVLG